MSTTELNLLLNKLVSWPKENEWLEFKVNNTGGEDVGKRISAISNSACLDGRELGYLVFGVEDKTKIVQGTKQHFQELKRGKEELEHWIIQRLNPRIDFRIYDFYAGTEKITIIEIPAAVAQPVRFLHEAYIRIGSITRKLNEFPEKERKIWQSSSTEKFEDTIALRGVEAENINSLLSFEIYFELLERQIPTRLDTMLERFIEEKLIKRAGTRYNITNLGAILFAKDLKFFPDLTRKSTRLIAYNGKNRTTSKKEYLVKEGYAAGFSSLMKLLDALIPTNEFIERAIRKSAKLYPEIALRELIANALIHQDFDVSGTGPMVEIFKDRIEISNPGKPIISTLRFIDHHPRSRNEKLAYFMRRLNFCEERGSGIDKVVAACEIYQLPAPEFIDGTDYVRSIIYAPKSWKSMTKKDKTRACYQHCVLKYVSGELMSNSTLRQRFQIEEKNYTIASRIISETTKAGLIKDSNPESKSKKHAKYIPFWAS